MSYDEFEHLAAQFVALSAQSVSDPLVSPIFASPLAARSPDLCMLWHTGYRQKHGFGLFLKLLFSVLAQSIKGVARISLNIRPLGYALYGTINDTVLVITATCGHENTEGEYKTAYVLTSKDDGLFVFGLKSSCGSNAQEVGKISIKYKLLLMSALLKSGIIAYFNVKGRMPDRVLLLLQWLSWVLSFQWLHDYYLEMSLSEVVRHYGIKKIGCIHEMHSYARVVWRVASKYKAASYTIQHAAISSGKRWYFCYPEEVQNGLVLPDTMYTYNKNVVERLKPYYKNTSFLLGCSYRYAHWQDVKANNNKGSYYLVVSALAGFDNEVLISTLRNLLSSTKKSIPIRIRFHPNAKIGIREMHWIQSKIKAGLIKKSEGTSLMTDIEGAIGVVGMSTTVLEEALMLGRPVVQLTHPDYLQYIDIEGIQGVVKKDYKELSVSDLLNLSNVQTDSEQMRARLGLNHNVITYERLFA